MTHRFRPAFEGCEPRALCTVAPPIIAVLGAGTAPVGPLVGHVLPGVDVVEPGPGDVDTSPISHDTATASIALAWCPDAQILPVIVTDPVTHEATTDTIFQGILEAVDLGATVINVSYASLPQPEGTFDYGPVSLALGFAQRHNVPVVFAAGNAANDNDLGPTFPSNDAEFYSNTVSVAAVNAAGSLASFSNWGSNSVTVAAPGVDVPYTDQYGGQHLASGTSFAAPAIAGELAVLRQYHPHQSAARLVQDLRRLAVPTPGAVGTTVDGGAILHPLTLPLPTRHHAP